MKLNENTNKKFSTKEACTGVPIFTETTTRYIRVTETYLMESSKFVSHKARELREFNSKINNQSGKIRCTLVSCTYRAPKVESRTTKLRVLKIFISSYLYLCYKFRSSTVTDKQ